MAVYPIRASSSGLGRDSRGLKQQLIKRPQTTHLKHCRRRNEGGVCCGYGGCLAVGKCGVSGGSIGRSMNVVGRAADGYKSFTRKMFDLIPSEKGVGGAGGKTIYDDLQSADEAWSRMKATNSTTPGPRPAFVSEESVPLTEAINFDVIICGGTLGIFVACALQMRGLKVAVIEKGPLKGRAQEWYISRKELMVLQEMGVLEEPELEACISAEWDRVRTGFYNGRDIWTSDVSNLGITPQVIIEKCMAKFLNAGGTVYERISLTNVSVHDNGVVLNLASVSISQRLTSRILLDCMGNGSPIVRQIRHGQKPDGACLVVGTLAEGFTENSFSDLIYTMTPAKAEGTVGNVQYFWEAFPGGEGPLHRTTYMFAYMDVSETNPSLEAIFEDYWSLMPVYQDVELSSLKFKRAMFGFFPAFKDSPLQPAFNRVLQIGNASGLQSPLSFGGFGSMLRHLRRITDGLVEALEVGAVDRSALGLINSYSPGLSGAWMMQKAMIVREDTPPDFVNTLLANNFDAMEKSGDWVIIPFLQDVPQFGPLSLTVLSQVVTKPLFIPAIIENVGLGALVEWVPHFGNLALFGLLYNLGTPFRPVVRYLPSRDGYRFRRLLDAWEYGSGNDFQL